MSPLFLALGIFAAMLVLMALRIPIAIAMFVAGALGYAVQAGVTPLAFFLNTQVFARFANYDLSVIPLFILMGQFATQGGISKDLFAFASVLLGRLRGGLAMAAVLANAAFGAICGSSVATAATITSVALPEMRRHGYSGSLATGTLAAGGTLGILIPPSVPLVIYALLTEQNIAKLFAAAMLPGLIAMTGYILAIAIYVRIFPSHAPAEHTSHNKLTAQHWRSVLPLAFIFALVFGGIYGGWFSPTEGAAVGASATLLAALVRGEMNLRKLRHCCYATAQGTGMVFLIFLGSDVMNSALALTQAPAALAAWVQGLGIAPMGVVVAIMLFYVVLGAVMDELAMILLTIPIFFPVVMQLDFGMTSEMTAIWFGIMVLMTVGFGLLAPPVGLNVYVVNSMAGDVPMAQSYRGVLPFLISDVLRTALLLAFPPISLWLVQFIG